MPTASEMLIRPRNRWGRGPQAQLASNFDRHVYFNTGGRSRPYFPPAEEAEVDFPQPAAMPRAYPPLPPITPWSQMTGDERAAEGRRFVNELPQRLSGFPPPPKQNLQALEQRAFGNVSRALSPMIRAATTEPQPLQAPTPQETFRVLRGYRSDRPPVGPAGLDAVTAPAPTAVPRMQWPDDPSRPADEPAPPSAAARMLRPEAPPPPSFPDAPQRPDAFSSRLAERMFDAGPFAQQVLQAERSRFDRDMDAVRQVREEGLAEEQAARNAQLQRTIDLNQAIAYGGELPAGPAGEPNPRVAASDTTIGRRLLRSPDVMATAPGGGQANLGNAVVQTSGQLANGSYGSPLLRGLLPDAAPPPPRAAGPDRLIVGGREVEPDYLTPEGLASARNQGRRRTLDALGAREPSEAFQARQAARAQRTAASRDLVQQAAANRAAARQFRLGTAPSMTGEGGDAFENYLMQVATSSRDPRMASQAGQMLADMRNQRLQAETSRYGVDTGAQTQLKVTEMGEEGANRRAELGAGTQRDVAQIGERGANRRARQTESRLTRQGDEENAIRRMEAQGRIDALAREQNQTQEDQQVAALSAILQDPESPDALKTEAQARLDPILARRAGMDAQSPMADQVLNQSPQQPGATPPSPIAESLRVSNDLGLNPVQLNNAVQLARQNDPEQAMLYLQRSGVSRESAERWLYENFPGLLGYRADLDTRPAAMIEQNRRRFNPMLTRPF